MPWVGHAKPHTLQTRMKISEVLLASPNTVRGERHHFWKGGPRKCECGTEIKSTRKNTVRCGMCARKNPSRYWAGKKRPEISGSNSKVWVHDRTKLSRCNEGRNSSAHREWSRQVKNRDYWKCQISNDDCSGHAEAHHILGWRSHPELRYEIKNGITLCHFHHPRRRIDEERYAISFQEIVAAKMQ